MRPTERVKKQVDVQQSGLGSYTAGGSFRAVGSRRVSILYIFL